MVETTKSVGELPLTSLILKMLNTLSNSELISVGVVPFTSMMNYNSQELTICGGLETGTLVPFSN